MGYVLLLAYAFRVCMIGSDDLLKAIPGHTVTREVRAFQLQPNGTTREAKIQARSIMINAAMPSGSVRSMNLLVLFDPAAGFYQWLFGVALDIERPADFGMFSSGKAVAYTSKDSFTLFRAGGPVLWVRESRMRATSMDAAEAQILRDASVWLPDFERGNTTSWKEISLAKVLGRDFDIPKGSALAGPVEIVQVYIQDGTWHVGVKGQWVEEFTLDDKYAFVNHRRVE